MTRSLLPLLLVLVSLGWSVPASYGQAAGKLPGNLADLLDANGDGMVTDAEAQAAVREFQKEAKNQGEAGAAALKALDKNGNGRVDPDEAAAAVAQGRAQMDEIGQRVDGIFEKLDVNQNGVITPDEMQLLLRQLGPLAPVVAPRLGQLFVRFDQNRDGAISFVESQLAAEGVAKDLLMQAERKTQQDRNQKHWQMAAQTIRALDTNRNQRLSSTEAKGLAKEFFQAIDADNSTEITLIEIYNFLEANPELAEQAGKQ